MRRFSDRREAGRVLASGLSHLAHRPDVVVLGLPRGGVPVAYEVATALDAPLDTFVVRKIGAPYNEEFAIGAMASGGIVRVDEDQVRALGVTPQQLAARIEREGVELRRRERAYRGDRPPPDLEGKTVILVDDGLATGSTMRAAVIAVRERRPARVLVAVPVASREACELVRQEEAECVCVETPDPFMAVGLWYVDFSQTSDDEVRQLLARAANLHPASP